jgi:DNA-binding response OmpR family regulator
VIVATYPDPPSEPILDGITLAGATTTAVTELAPEDPVISEADILLVDLTEQPMRRLRESGRVADTLGIPILAIADQPTLAMLEGVTGITDFLLTPVDPLELRLRLKRIGAGTEGPEVLEFKDLELSPLHFRATLAGEPMDLTFMEYELLRFFMQNPGRVWSREQLLSKVWGYEYYGGARTVDVHVRRLRSKLGEERSSWISTVRSVGYRFG